MENHAAVIVRLDLNTTRLTAALERSKAGTNQPQAIGEPYKSLSLRRTILTTS